MMDFSQPVVGGAYPFGMANCDTDVIIASEWLKTINRSGLGIGAFGALRIDPGNVFDDPRYRGAPILIAGDNFGCGSSREHAAWALADLGIRIVIAPSFSDIFSGNAFKNGILTIVLPDSAIAALLDHAEQGQVTIYLADQTVSIAGGALFEFEIDPFRKNCLLNGLDEISLTLESVLAISAT